MKKVIIPADKIEKVKLRVPVPQKPPKVMEDPRAYNRKKIKKKFIDLNNANTDQ